MVLGLIFQRKDFMECKRRMAFRIPVLILYVEIMFEKDQKEEKCQLGFSVEFRVSRLNEAGR